MSNCDPDNNPGPAFDKSGTDTKKRWKYNPKVPNLNIDSHVNSKYAYDITRLVKDGQPVMWDGKEPHAAVKPEWMIGFGATDFKLSLDSGKAYWANLADYNNRVLSVDYTVKNNPPDPPGPLNYPASCGGAPAPQGNCPAVLQDPHGPSYNTTIVEAPATNGVTALNLPAGVVVPGVNYKNGGVVGPNHAGIATVKYLVPKGVSYFSSNPVVKANDVPNPKGTLFGPGYEFYFTYMYTDWTYDVGSLPPQPLVGISGV